MRTTIDIPDELLRAAKARAALEGRSLKDLLIEGLLQTMKQPAPKRRKLRKADFPIIKSARTGRKITDEMVQEAVEQLYQDEAEQHAQFMRR